MDNKDNKSVNVLQITIGDGSYGGVASFLYSYYSHMNHDKVHFDFLYCGENSMKSKMDTSVLKESKITTLHALKPKGNGIKEYLKLAKLLKKYFGQNHYDIVHINTANVFVSAIVTHFAHKGSICIAHSHNTKSIVKNKNVIVESVKTLIRKPCRQYILAKDEYFFACSKAAAVNLYGKKILSSDKFRVIKNAIDISKYTYDTEIRKQYRKSDKFIFGHVGRLTEQKNPEFLIQVFYEIHKKNKNTELWMIGEGEKEKIIKNLIHQLGLEDSVVLYGRRGDVANIMQAMDMFLLPSLYEGLSIVAIEAQAAGLPIVASDSISPEHKVSNLVRFLPLDDGAEKWAEYILEYMDELEGRKSPKEELEKEGYEINTATLWLEEFYANL